VEAASGLWMDRFAQAGLTRATAEALAREFGPPPSNEPGPPNTDALPVAFMAYSIRFSGEFRAEMSECEAPLKTSVLLHT